MESGLVVTVEGLQPYVDQWRIATVEAAAAGGPAHVTALYPWLDAPVAPARLQDLAAQLNDFPPVSLTFDRLERFPSGVLYLALDEQSEQRMRRLSRTLMDAYPDCLPYGGEFPDPHPHLTIAKGTEVQLDEIEPQVARALAPLLPYTITATEVVVMEQQSDGRWLQAHRVPLRDAAADRDHGVRAAFEA